MKKIFLILGKACAGKDTIVKTLQELMDIPMAVSFTTRPKRKGETNGVEYNFISLEELDKLNKQGKIAESTSYNVAGGDTWYYGLSREELEKSDYVIAIVNPEGAKAIKEIYKDKVETILITANDKERIARYLKRDNTNNVAECCRRYLADEIDFKDFKADLTIENYDLGKSVDKLFTFISITMANQIHKEQQIAFANNPAKFIGENRC